MTIVDVKKNVHLLISPCEITPKASNHADSRHKNVSRSVLLEPAVGNDDVPALENNGQKGFYLSGSENVSVSDITFPKELLNPLTLQDPTPLDTPQVYINVDVGNACRVPREGHPEECGGVNLHSTFPCADGTWR